ncbi:hypothetical protein OG976_00205 [Mycobacterium sp. NBC_00419]|uniref:hypothetical protein n=1 Tax=Mycobacterium sp. NBC_00419 TaxID=2975989 RepID=UPI002E1BC540
MGSAAALLAFASAGPSPHATADAVQVPCGVLNQLRDTLDNSVSAGIGGVRTVITSPYFTGGPQKRDADANLALVSHGVHALEDINGANNVPSLAPMLTALGRAADDMTAAVDALFQPTGGGFGYGFDYGSTLSVAWPQPATWTVIDYADQKKDDVYALVNGLQTSCTG